ncbi:hypothetical protein SAMN04515648_2899 [Phyllobacterium sp. CL33Tsu]|uniref:hypothetical protein n=1 Tax=Phyllobacterium sp. CL33Tsu TaxID=1798191 RepID=UPI0008F29D5A|nr:hypothetical protein [Phyllobacterium sp. CL33Tsu]SFJ15214.1 hypothetical protein SAMN04515648_2899 [Phyllobacterium sp. CL33Tsu]
MKTRVNHGLRPYQAARELGVSYPMFKQAMDQNHVRYVEFGNAKLITPMELERLKRMFHGELGDVGR